MKFDIYGRFQLDILRDGRSWVAYRIADGKRVPDAAIAIPASLRPDELAGYLDDLYHELASPGRTIRALP
jgi:hypothetical protein